MIADRRSGSANAMVRPRICYCMRPAGWNAAEPLIISSCQRTFVIVDLFTFFVLCLHSREFSAELTISILATFDLYL